jgi:hypothetical protein
MDPINLEGNVRFGITTHHPSGMAINADETPRWYVREDGSDTIIHQDLFTLRTGGFPGCYKGHFVASGSLGFEQGKYYEIMASGKVAGLTDYDVIDRFILDGIYRANVVQISGTPISYTNLVDDLYFADIKYIKDNAGPLQDDYAAVWFKNGQILSSGQLTNPAMSVVNAINGTALFSNAVMSYPTTQLAAVQYTQTTAGNLTASGIPYVVRVSGTIDGATRTWPLVIGLDT